MKPRVRKELFEVEIPEGKSLAIDKKTGKNLGTLLDARTNKVSAQARLTPVNQPGDSGIDLQGIAAIGQVGLQIGIAIYSMVQQSKARKQASITIEQTAQAAQPAPPVQRVRNVVPTNPLKQKRYQGMPQGTPAPRRIVMQPQPQPQMEQVAFMTSDGLSSMIDQVINDYIFNSEDPEIQRRLVRIVFLSMMLAQEIRGLVLECQKNHKAINMNYLEWQPVMEKLLTQRIFEGVNRILISHPSFWDDNIGLISQDNNIKQLLGNNKYFQFDSLSRMLSVQPQLEMNQIRYCAYCGARVQVSGAAFCAHCGSRL